MFNILFVDILEVYVLIRRIKIKLKLNFYVIFEICQLMKICDKWYKKVIKINDCFCWNVFKFFRQEVKREFWFVEKVYVQFEIIGSKGNINVIWKIINCCLFRKSKILLNINDNLINFVDKFNEYFISVGSLMVQKVYDFVMEYDFNFVIIILLLVIWKYDECFDDFQFYVVIEQEVGKVIKGLFLNKVFGYDKIIVCVFKDSLLVILLVIISIMNNLFSIFIFLKVWKMVEVVFVLKLGCFEDLCNN